MATSISAFPSIEDFHTLRIDSEGRVVVGLTVSNGSDHDFGLARLNPDGSVDSTFGTGGKVVTDYRLTSSSSIEIQEDGKIVAVGHRGTLNVLARHNVDGTLDTSYRGDGSYEFFAGQPTHDAILQPDGKIVVLSGSGTLYELARVESSFVTQDSDSVIVIDDETPLDLGDAPDRFGTLIESGGAFHGAVGPMLGPTRDAEPDGQPSADATGDGNDEDGVMFGLIRLNSDMAGVNIDLQNAASAKVDAWIDFDQNGQWDASEQILLNRAVQPGLQTLNYTVPNGALPGITFARVRLSTDGNLQPHGPANDGEVEDYQIEIPPLPNVEQVIVNDGGLSRSQITSLSVTFNTEVNHSDLQSAFTLTNITTQQQVTSLVVGTPVNQDGKTNVVLTFNNGVSIVGRDGTGALGNSLADGDYRLDILAAQVRSVALDVTMAEDYVFGGKTAADPEDADRFFRFFGDTDGDRDVDGSDYGRFGLTFLKTLSDEGYRPDLDAEGDGGVDGQDYGYLGLNFFKQL